METPRHGPHDETPTTGRPPQPTLADLWVHPAGDGCVKAGEGAGGAATGGARSAGRPVRHPAELWTVGISGRTGDGWTSVEAIARQQQQIRSLQREWRGLHDDTARAQRQRAALSRVKRRRQRMDEHQRAEWVQLRRQLKVIRGGR